MRCEEFLEGYSEFLDGRLDERRQAAFEAHRDACRACGRYDHVVQRGLGIWRSLPEVDPSPDFVPRLRHRLYHVDEESRAAQHRHLGSAALVAVASVGLLALAWLPFATRASVEIELPPVAVETPGPVTASPAATPVAAGADAPALFGSGPFVVPAAGVRYETWPPSTGDGLEFFFDAAWSGAAAAPVTAARRR